MTSAGTDSIRLLVLRANFWAKRTSGGCPGPLRSAATRSGTLPVVAPERPAATIASRSRLVAARCGRRRACAGAPGRSSCAPAARELRLQLERDVADLVEEERPASASRNVDALGDRGNERLPPFSRKLAFNRPVGTPRSSIPHERALGAESRKKWMARAISAFAGPRPPGSGRRSRWARLSHLLGARFGVGESPMISCEVVIGADRPRGEPSRPRACP